MIFSLSPPVTLPVNTAPSHHVKAKSHGRVPPPTPAIIAPSLKNQNNLSHPKSRGISAKPSLITRQLEASRHVSKNFPRFFTTEETLDAKLKLLTTSDKKTMEATVILRTAEQIRPLIAKRQKMVETYLNSFTYDLAALKIKQASMASSDTTKKHHKNIEETQAISMAMERYDGVNQCINHTPNYEIAFLIDKKSELLSSIKHSTPEYELQKISEKVLEINAAIKKCELIEQESDNILNSFSGPFERFEQYAEKLLTNTTEHNQLLVSHAIKLASSKVEYRKKLSTAMLCDALMQKYSNNPEALEEFEERLITASPALEGSKFHQAIEHTIRLLRQTEHVFESDSESENL